MSEQQFEKRKLVIIHKDAEQALLADLIANELFKGTKPMTGPELDCLNEALLKSARKEPTIKRKKQ